MKITRQLSIGVFALTLCCGCVETPEIRENVPEISVDDVIDRGSPVIELIGRCSVSEPSSCEFYFVCASSQEGLAEGTVLKAEQTADGAYRAVYVPRGEIQLWYRFCAKNEWSFVQSEDKSFKYVPASPKKRFTSITWTDRNGVAGDIRLRYDSQGRMVCFSEVVNTAKTFTRVEMSGEYQSPTDASFSITCFGDSFHSGYERYNAVLHFDDNGMIVSADVPGYTYPNLNFVYAGGFVSGISSGNRQLYGFVWDSGNVSEMKSGSGAYSYEYLTKNDLNGIFPYFFDPGLLSGECASPFVGLLAAGTVPDNVNLPSYSTDIKSMKDSFEYSFDGSGNVLTVKRFGTEYAIGYDEPADYGQPVDMGLPSGLKWAQVNLGATSPEGFGDYYAWGETEIKSDYSWATYKWGSDPITKYCTVDGLTVLESEDDAAHVRLGGSWRMPTEAEFTELIDNCECVWTTQNGVSGRKFTSRKNGKSIFLPAAGYRDGVELDRGFRQGDYWSSTLTDWSSGAYDLLFASNHMGMGTDFGRRYLGLSVRPVNDESTVHVSAVSLDKSAITFAEGESEALTVSISPENAHDRNVTWSSSNPDVASVDGKGLVKAIKIGEATITVTSHDGGHTATCAVTVTGPAGPEAVDLGLPSGLKWASCNVGASKPEEYGGYYQWAGTRDVTDKSIYLDWSNCPYHTGSSSSKGWTKYIPSNKSSYWSGSGKPDNKTILDPEDDVAHVKLGGKWRMPTEDEFDELIDNCTSEWTELNGVEGRMFTSRKNGKSIFLPAAGRRYDDGLYDVGSYGTYWSSSLYTDDPYGAYDMGFNSGYVYTNYYCYRYFGQSVRPVNDESTVHVSAVSLDKSAITLAEGESEALTVSISPENAHDRNVIWSSSNPDVASVDGKGLVKAIKIGEATITVTSHDGGHTATCAVTVTGPAGPEAVDLGLPSGLKWASCNVGASKPEEYGGYYQWAGTRDVTDQGIYLDWSNCPYHTGSSSSKGWTKYIPSNKSSYWSGSGKPDNKTALDPGDDVAHVKLGGSWRMPTNAEFIELYNNCTSEWTTLNGVKGRKFTSRKNGKSIFLPAAGYRGSGGLYDVGSSGYYWFSSLDAGGPADAYYMGFDSGDVGMGYDNRYYGQSVRPVNDESTVHVSAVSLDKSAITLAEGESEALTVSISPENAHDRNVTWSSSNSDVATVDENGLVKAIKIGNATITVTSHDGGHTATCAVTVTGPAGPEAVDLGLPSGLKWASCNVGASKPEDYGGYYQWAGTRDVTDKSIYLDWSNCPYHTGSSSSKGWTKYIPSNKSSYWSGSGKPDNKTALDPGDDVAHVKLGGSWRMPTNAEFEELRDNCNTEWTELNGVEGRMFTSRKNGKSIFLPAAGYRYDGYLSAAGSYGLYWSSSLCTDGPYYAYFMFFHSDGVYPNYSNRCYGLSVRPVSE